MSKFLSCCHRSSFKDCYYIAYTFNIHISAASMSHSINPCHKQNVSTNRGANMYVHHFHLHATMKFPLLTKPKVRRQSRVIAQYNKVKKCYVQCRAWPKKRKGYSGTLTFKNTWTKWETRCVCSADCLTTIWRDDIEWGVKWVDNWWSACIWC